MVGVTAADTVVPVGTRRITVDQGTTTIVIATNVPELPFSSVEPLAPLIASGSTLIGMPTRAASKILTEPLTIRISTVSLIALLS